MYAEWYSSTLTNVIKMLQDLQHWPYLKRLILSGSIRQNISNAHEDIDQACRLFHVSSLFRVSLSVLRGPALNLLVGWYSY